LIPPRASMALATTSSTDCASSKVTMQRIISSSVIIEAGSCLQE
jgi:hypothetical protein